MKYSEIKKGETYVFSLQETKITARVTDVWKEGIDMETHDEVAYVVSKDAIDSGRVQVTPADTL